MTPMVVGFAFSCGDVLLVNKRKPAWQAGKLNGVGGKIEKDESAISAMVREFEEETGQCISAGFWKYVAVLIHSDCSLFVYTVNLDSIFDVRDICKFQKETDAGEPLSWVSMTGLYEHRTIENLKWLIPLCWYEYLNPHRAEPKPDTTLIVSPRR